MITINDFKDPYDAVTEFEQQIAEYTGAPYAVATDSCTHAIELCLRLLNPKFIMLPKYTYLSIPMLMHKLNIEYNLNDYNWYDDLEYNLMNTEIWDSARKLEPNMYDSETFRCLSFGHTKPIEIGRGGMILLDNPGAYKWLKRASYDGRDLKYNKWEDQRVFHVGYHYMMRPEEAITGLNILESRNFNDQFGKFSYPDLTEIVIR